MTPKSSRAPVIYKYSNYQLSSQRPSIRQGQETNKKQWSGTSDHGQQELREVDISSVHRETTQKGRRAHLGVTMR